MEPAGTTVPSGRTSSFSANRPVCGTDGCRLGKGSRSRKRETDEIVPKNFFDHNVEIGELSDGLSVRGSPLEDFN